jgi:hypothetical protein
MTTTATLPTATVPTEIADLIDDLTGFHPVLDRLVAAFGDVLAADFTADESMSAVAVLGGLADGHLATLLGLVLRQVANPDTNRALAHLPADRQQKLRRLGAEYAAEISSNYLARAASEACAVIEGP